MENQNKFKVLAYAHKAIGNDTFTLHHRQPVAEFGWTSEIIELVDKRDLTDLQEEHEALLKEIEKSVGLPIHRIIHKGLE